MTLNVTPLQYKILQVVWQSGGYAFGGTARDILRGEQPNDLDVRLGTSETIESVVALGVCIASDPKSSHGEAYYDKKLIFENGEQVHIIYGWCSVTDCDINLIKLYKEKIELLYRPRHLQYSNPHPLLEVLDNIRKKQFVPLVECEEHRRYRWDEFVKRGWKMLNSPL